VYIKSYHIILINFLYWQDGPVVPQAPCQMDRDATPAQLLGAESPTPVTQGTWGLQVVLVEHVCLVATGQGVIQHVPVSSRFVASISW